MVSKMQKDVSGSGTPAESSPVTSALIAVLRLVVSGSATSRAEIARSGGLARSTVGHQVDHLVARGILSEVDGRVAGRGRPPRILTISPQAGSIAVADIDSLVSRVALADLTGRVIARETVPIRIDTGPGPVLNAVGEALAKLLARHDRDPERLREIVTCLPGPVDFEQGCAVHPTGMPGWDRYPVAGRLRERFGSKVVVDNDANLMALGEADQGDMEAPLLCLKVDSGIGAGLVSGRGEVYRGADGAAGDIGHIRAPGGGDFLCNCGNVGCVGAIASHRAVLRNLGIPESTEQDPIHGTHALENLVANGDPRALHALRQAAKEIGEVAAMLVHMYNPRTLVLSGALSELRDDLLSGVRAVVYQRALPLATRNLTITRSRLGSNAAIHGGIALATRDVFSPTGIAALLGEEPAPTP
jgi:predicted NBD/HSP70 family sugar kinase